MSLFWRMALKNGQAGRETSAEADTPFTLKILSLRIGIPPRLISTIYQTLRLFFLLSFSLWDTFSTCLIISPCSPQSPDVRSCFSASLLSLPLLKSRQSTFWHKPAPKWPHFIHQSTDCTSAGARLQFPICLDTIMSRGLIYTFV